MTHKKGSIIELHKTYKTYFTKRRGIVVKHLNDADTYLVWPINATSQVYVDSAGFKVTGLPLNARLKIV